MRVRAILIGVALLGGVACNGGPKKVTTTNGTFEVPGAAQTRPRSLGFSTMESGCEIPGGGASLQLRDVKVDGASKRTKFLIERTQCPAGWLDEAHVFPVGAK